ncbi:MAG: branched-chain amino acid transport system substrate-binding protein [Frankiales bacterium]|nr:branched-chain amino acid transport system substrate-binding protein [Frankiales bacterium]
MRLPIALFAAFALLAACGTRLPDTAFPPPGSTVVTTQLPGGLSGTATAAPTTTVTAGPGAGPLQSGRPGSGASAPPGSGLTNGRPNTASDVGVTPTTITLGQIVSRSNPFDPKAFVGPMYGAAAFVSDLNARGGINGRTVRLVTCDDHGDGSRNTACAHSLIDNSHVFALVSQSIFTYGGASYVQSKGVPDVGSQPIDTAYDRWSHLWDIYGEAYPRDGTVGYHGSLIGGTEVYQYFKQKYGGPLKAGVVYYNVASSTRFGQSIASGLRAEGYSVVEKQINFALPDFDSAVLDMRSQGVKYVYDALDTGGNVSLCRAMDADGLTPQVTAKVTTTQGWVGSIKSDYADSPGCRNKLWATGNDLNYEDVGKPQVKRFRDAMARLHLDGADQLSEWALEGWAGATWLTDAMGSCGADLTRRCVEGYMGSGKPYDAGGLLTPRSFRKYSAPKTIRTCINAARWQDGAGWVTQVADMTTNCFDAKQISYQP